MNALARSVEETWNHGHLDNMITRVFNRLQKVLVLIVEAKGKNYLVETKRGKKIAGLDLSAAPPNPLNPTDLVEEEEI